MLLHKSLPRRTFLRGMGTAVALPFLDAMVPALARAGASKAPVRMAFVYVPNGIDMRYWNPDYEGTLTTLPRILKSLEPFKQDITLLGNLTHNEHLRETGFLSGEAALNSLVMTSALKQVMQRQRPYQGGGNGDFFRSGSSFPSEHAAAARRQHPARLAQVVSHITGLHMGEYGPCRYKIKRLVDERKLVIAGANRCTLVVSRVVHVEEKKYEIGVSRGDMMIAPVDPVSHYIDANVSRLAA